MTTVSRLRQADKLRRYRLLARVSNVINSSLNPRTVLNVVLREAVKIMRATSGSIVLIDPHTQLLEIDVSIGLTRKARELKLAIGHGVTGHVAKTGRPLRVPDVRQDARYVAVRSTIRSELAVPLVVEDVMIGVLNVDSIRLNAFSADDEELLMTLANQAAKVIHHSWLYQAVAHNAQQLESLFSVAQSMISSLDLEDVLQRVTRDACQVMQTKVCSLMLLNPAGDRLMLRACHGAGDAYRHRPPLSVDESLTGSVVRRCKPVQVYDVQTHDAFRHAALAREEGLVSLLSVPMVYAGASIGALNVYTSSPYRFSNQDIKTLSALANLAAVAIENARLHGKVMDAEEHLRRSERLSTLGLLAAEVAHEIRNPLTAMKLLFHALDLKFDAQDPRTRDAEIMIEKMDHLNRIVGQLLRIARTNDPVFEPLEVNRVLEDVLLLARHTLTSRNIRVERRFSDGLPKVRADRGQLEQLCLNLILNASEAMTTGGVMTLVTSMDETTRRRVRMSFADNGPGIPPEIRERLFQPFLTTKGTGTGLGLAIVKKIVESHQGEVRVEGRSGRGAVFHVFLPAGAGRQHE